MYQTDQSTAASSLPTPAAAGTQGFFTGGNPAEGEAATILDADWLNMVQAELINIVEAAGETPSKTTYNQVLTAIKLLMQQSVANVGTDTGAANAYVVAFTPALTAPVPWVPFWFKVAHTNTGESTINATGTVEPLVGAAHAALQGNELVANGNALVYWNPTLNSNAGAYVLMFCSGAAEQIAPATASQHAVQLGQVSGVVGQVRNLKASLSAAATSVAYTADEIVVESALGGLRYCLANFSQTLNGATTGLGGLDTGSLAASSYYSIYAAITSAGAQGIFAQLEPSGGATSVYGGTHLPAGVIATALIGVWPTNPSSQFIAGMQTDRSFDIAPNTQLSTSSQTSGVLTSLSIAGAVPKAARIARGNINATATGSSANQTVGTQIASNSAGFGTIGAQIVATGGDQCLSTYAIRILTAQTIYYATSVLTGTPSNFTVSVTGYDF